MRKTISFTSEYEDEFEYLCNQDNPSLYVRQLIRRDRTSEKSGIERRLESLIAKLENKSFQVYSSEPKQVSQIKQNALKNMLKL